MSPLCLTLVFYSSFSLCENTLGPWSPVTSAPPLPTNQCRRRRFSLHNCSYSYFQCASGDGPPTISFEPAPLKAQVSLRPDLLCFPGPQREAHSPWSTSLEVVSLKWRLGAGLEDCQLSGDKQREKGNSNVQRGGCGSRESTVTLSRLTQGHFHITSGC